VSAAPAAVPSAFGINPSRRATTYRVGREGQAVVVVDDVLADPHALVELIAETADFQPTARAGNFYPGLRAPAPPGYVRSLSAALGPLVAEAFGDLAGRTARTSACLSLVTFAPEELVLAQRLPHFDAADGGQIAVLHYLCDAAHGGTAFYRHRSTGFETVTPERLQAYVSTLEGEVAAAPPPQAYVSGDTPLFEQIGAVDGRFDRVVIYRSRLLHSGAIAAGANLSPDPRQGRLTANSFLFF
jgi:hypothetical protein